MKTNKTCPKTIKKEFLENRTSWEWFEGVFNNPSNQGYLWFQALIQLEILKELQYLNDTQKAKGGK